MQSTAVVLVAVILSACGGGSSGGGDEQLPVSQPPAAASGSLSTNEDTVGTGMLNAIDPDGDALTYSIVSSAGKGTASITNPASGAYTYTPDPDTTGTDSFTFKANDGLADSNVATVLVTVMPVNDPPVATGNCSTTPQAKTLTGTLKATDVETPTLLMYALGADGSDGLGPITTAKNGTVTITNATTGAFTYQPAGRGGRGTDSFVYWVGDPDGGGASATETVVVDEKIMPLGDSITDGVIGGTVLPLADRLGYRKPLYDLLAGARLTFDFVGSLASGANALPDFDVNHEGHGGLSAADIALNVGAWLALNPADIVLLHAGTNALNTTSQTDIAAILDAIDQWENSANGNHVTVLLALIIDQQPNNPLVTTLNTAVRAMANARIAAGDDIIIVDQHAALNYVDDMSDTLHPNDLGYAKMGNTWFGPLSPLVDSCGP